MTQEPRKFVIYEDVAKEVVRTLCSCIHGQIPLADIKKTLHHFESGLCLIEEKKCAFADECPLAREDSVTCMKDGGGNYCGAFREQYKKYGREISEHIYERVYRDIGHASMCWDCPEKAGTFDTEQAVKIAFTLCDFIADQIDEEKEKSAMPLEVKPGGKTDGTRMVKLGPW